MLMVYISGNLLSARISNFNNWRVSKGSDEEASKSKKIIYRSLRLVLLSSSVLEELFFFLSSTLLAADDGETLLGEEGLDPE